MEAEGVMFVIKRGLLFFTHNAPDRRRGPWTYAPTLAQPFETIEQAKAYPWPAGYVTPGYEGWPLGCEVVPWPAGTKW